MISIFLNISIERMTIPAGYIFGVIFNFGSPETRVTIEHTYYFNEFHNI